MVYNRDIIKEKITMPIQIPVQTEEKQETVAVRVKMVLGDVTISKIVPFTETLHFKRQLNGFDRSDEWKECEA